MRNFSYNGVGQTFSPSSRLRPSRSKSLHFRPKESLGRPRWSDSGEARSSPSVEQDSAANYWVSQGHSLILRRAPPSEQADYITSDNDLNNIDFKNLKTVSLIAVQNFGKEARMSTESRAQKDSQTTWLCSLGTCRRTACERDCRGGGICLCRGPVLAH